MNRALRGELDVFQVIDVLKDGLAGIEGFLCTRSLSPKHPDNLQFQRVGG